MTVIIDRGRLEVRVGVSGPEPAVVEFSSTKNNEDFLQQEVRIIRDHLKHELDSEKQRVIACVPLDCSILEPAVLCQHYFEAAGANSMCLITTPFAAAISHGLNAAMVCDFGHTSSRIAPVNDGTVHRSASLRCSALSGISQNKIIDSIGLKNGPECHQFKVENAVVPSEQEVKSESSEYTLPDGKKIFVSGKLKEDLGRCFFSTDLFGHDRSPLNAPGLLKLAISGAPAEIPLSIYQENVVLCGGISSMKGFSDQFRTYFESEDSQGQKNFKFHCAPDSQNTSWRGGSILSNLNSVSTVCVTRAEYMENGPNFILRRCL